VTELRARLLREVGQEIGRGHARSRLLNAAIEIFAARGVAASRVEDILVAADLSRRTFYQHFRDKHDVVRAIYELVIRHLAATMLEAGAGGGEPMAAVLRSLDAYLEIHRADRAIVRALIEESLRRESPLFAMRARFREQIVAAFVAMFRAHTSRDLDPLVALALVSALEGLSMELLADEITDDQVARTRAVVVSLIQLVLAHPDQVPVSSTRCGGA
jgi:AcrR family transcriptional regulator